MIQRFGKTEGIISLIVPAIVYSTLAGSIFYVMWPYFYYVKNETLIALGLFASWRYGWQMLNYSRAAWYAFVRYPALKRHVNKISEQDKFPSHVYFIIPSYKEEPWVTVETIQSILSNLTQIPSSATLVVATGSDKDDAVITATFEAHPARHKAELVFQRQEEGKRIAMGHALRAVARRYDDDPNSVTVFMDGDSYLESNTLSKTIPFFSAFKDLGALTTNEVAYINTRSQWYKDWFNLKFGQRHVLFQSHALSNKVLTLTGRFSVFRTSIVVKEDFISTIENDVLTHWLHGKFRFLMGDDKSSWFYLLKKGWNMLYIPDVLVYSLESRDASFWELSTSLPYRWYGNTLRNNARSLKLGMKKTGTFIWFAILDQRLSMWTSLVGIAGAVFLSIAKSFIYLPFYLGWVLMVRILQMSIIAFRGHPVSLLTVPLMLYNQWVGSLIKIRAFFHLGDQSWSKGGDAQSGDKNHFRVENRLATIMPKYLHYLSYVVFLFVLGVVHQTVQMPTAWAVTSETDARVIDASQHGVIANDGIDDAALLNQLINSAPAHATILLPNGQLDFHQPLTITRSNISLRGREHTEIVASFNAPATGVMQIHGQQGKKIGQFESVANQSNQINVALNTAPLAGQMLLFVRDNDDAFLQQLGSKVWNKPYPQLRRQLNRVIAAEGSRLTLAYPLDEVLQDPSTKVFLVNGLHDIALKNFTLRYDIKGEDIAAHRFVYENPYENHAIDSISLKWTDKVVLQDLVLRNAGSHPIAMENTLATRGHNIKIDGAWNKGKKGRGYLRFSKTHYSEFSQLTVKNIRHIVFQWGASHNRIDHVYAEVDINFHGGYSHDNKVTHSHLAIPKQHPWPAVYRTPDDAHWAPPDGSGNRVH